MPFKPPILGVRVHIAILHAADVVCRAGQDDLPNRGGGVLQSGCAVYTVLTSTQMPPLQDGRLDPVQPKVDIIIDLQRRQQGGCATVLTLEAARVNVTTGAQGIPSR